MSKLFLPLLKNQYHLNEVDLDIWQFSLNQTVTTQEHALLSDEEKNRANRFYFDRHKRRFSIARIRLRQILAYYLGIAPEAIQFEYQPHGKPFIENDTKIQFNLSHSQDLALLTIGKQHALGIDLEFFSSRSFLGLSKELFSNEENQQLHRLPLSLRAVAFFNVWSQKEALIKAVGLGLSYPTQSFTVPVTPTSQPIQVTDQTATWHIQTFSPAIACQAAVCYHPHIQRIRYGIYEKLFST